MKFRLLLASFSIVVSATSAMAAGPYMGAELGATILNGRNDGFTKTSYDVGGALNASAGCDFDGVRIEGEFGYKTANTKIAAYTFGRNSGGGYEYRTTVNSLMANAFWDIIPKSIVTPVLGAGVGVLDLGDGLNGVLGYQLSAGVAFKVGSHLHLDLAYRFQGDANIGGKSSPYQSSNILTGLRYNF